MSRPLRSATSAIVGFGAKVTGVGAALAAMTAGVSAVAVAASSVKKAMDFESQLSSIQALTGATNDEMTKMQALALKMGAATKYNALEAAQGIEELLKAGLSPATVQAGGLEAALNLATAGGLGLADAAEIMATSLNTFKKDGLTAAQASDILAGTANASATGVADLRYSLTQASAVAAGLRLSFEDTNIALGIFANNGIKGEQAGTALKTMLSRLQPTTKDNITLFKKLGLLTANGSNAFFDSAGNIKSMSDIAGTLQKSLKKLNNQQRQLTLNMLFGEDAQKAASFLFEEGADGVKKFREEMLKVTALDVAKKKMDNAAGAVEQFKGAIETLQIAALLPTMPIIKDFALGAADAVEKYMPQIEASMKSAMTKLHAYMNTNYLQNDEFMALKFADKVKVVAADVKKVFDTWWASSGQAQFTAVSENITTTLLASLENSFPTITKIGLDIGSGLMSGIVDGMRDSKSLGWVFKGIDIGTPKFVKEAWKAIGIDTGTKDVTFSNATASTGASSRAIASGQATPSFGPDSSGFAAAANKHKQSSGLSRVPYSGYPAILHKDETVLHRGEARDYRNGNSGGSVNVSGNTFVVREEADIQRVAVELYRLINGADQAMGGAY